MHLGPQDLDQVQYREITPPELVEQPFEWEGMPGHILVERAEFEDLGGRTRVTTRSLFHTTRTATACSTPAWRAA